MQIQSKAFIPGVFLKTETPKAGYGEIPGTYEIDTPEGACLAKKNHLDSLRIWYFRGKGARSVHAGINTRSRHRSQARL